MDFLTEYQRQNIPSIGKLGKLSRSDFVRIRQKIGITDLSKDICWIWQGTIPDKLGKGHQHGVIWYNQKYVQVHRLLYHNFVEDVPEYKPKGLIVLHKCSTDTDGRCVNPWHLKLGTSKENTLDAKKAETLHMMGSNQDNPMSKLDDTTVQQIIALKNTGKSQRQVAETYGIHQSQVSRYWNNITRHQI